MFDVRGLISFYPCHDLAATADFYGRDLRLKLARDQGSCLIFQAAGRGYLGFCHHDGALPKHLGLIITLLIDDVDGAYQRLRSLNVEVEDKPKVNEHYGIYHFFARDPSGYRVEIQRFLEPLE
jgi:predicted enzyme related to lactoylglutathione lyase